MDHNFESQLFVSETEARPAIWDSKATLYSDKVENIRCLKVCVQKCFNALRQKRWRKLTR